MNLRTFLAYAVKLELDAESVYRQSAAAMDALKNRDAAAFFREMAGYCHLHYEEAMRRAGFNDLSDLPELSYPWPDALGPESLRPIPAGTILDLEGATGQALAAERCGVAFYEHLARTADDPDVRSLAEEIAAEERGHVLALERFMGWKPW